MFIIQKIQISINFQKNHVCKSLFYKDIRGSERLLYLNNKRIYKIVAKDTYHDLVKSALIKDKWTITDDPLDLEIGQMKLYIDLGAEKLIQAKKDNVKIAVEIKSFIGKSYITEFHRALGQFINYRIILQENNLNHILYLAVPEYAYYNFFQKEKLAKLAVKYNKLNLLVYDTKKEVITKWIS